MHKKEQLKMWWARVWTMLSMLLMPSQALASGAIQNSIFFTGTRQLIIDSTNSLILIIALLVVLVLLGFVSKYLLAGSDEKETVKLACLKGGRTTLIIGIVGILVSSLVNLIFGYFNIAGI